jgi:hypothetical protein
MTTANDLSVRRALENAGVEFIDENGGDRVCACVSPRKKSLENRLSRRRPNLFSRGCANSMDRTLTK